MTTRTTSLTRPERRKLYTATAVVAWCTLALLMLGLQSHRYQIDMTDAGPVSVSIRSFGAPTMLTVTTRTMSDGTATTIWDWIPTNIAVVTITLGLWAVLCWMGYAWLVDRRRVHADRCDHCGYNLTGVSAPRCPECGAGRM